MAQMTMAPIGDWPRWPQLWPGPAMPSVWPGVGGSGVYPITGWMTDPAILTQLRALQAEVQQLRAQLKRRQRRKNRGRRR